MTGLDWIVWMAGIIILCACCYLLGRADGEKNPNLSEDHQLELQKYAYDKFYEHERWKEERSETHE